MRNIFAQYCCHYKDDSCIKNPNQPQQFTDYSRRLFPLFAGLLQIHKEDFSTIRGITVYLCLYFTPLRPGLFTFQEDNPSTSIILARGLPERGISLGPENP